MYIHVVCRYWLGDNILIKNCNFIMGVHDSRHKHRQIDNTSQVWSVSLARWGSGETW